MPQLPEEKGDGRVVSRNVAAVLNQTKHSPRAVAKMGITLVASLYSATNRAVELSADLGIAIVGYACGNRLSVFSGEERLRVTGN